MAFSSETMGAIIQCNDIFDERKSKRKHNSTGKASFKREGKIKIFSDKKRMRELVAIRSALKEISKKVL